MSMTKLQEFLLENDIYCDTCAHYTKNTPIANTVNDICGLESNKQTNVYAGQYLRLPPDAMCYRWTAIEVANAADNWPA